MLFGVPTMYHRLIDAAASDPAVGAALRRARLLVSGSAALPVAEHERARQVAGLSIYERYGLTETLIDCAVRADGPPRPGYVGPPLAGVELQLVDEARRPIAANDDTTLGEIAVRGRHLFDGYLGNPAATAAVMDLDGWFYTGDVGTIAPDGAVRVHGRRATDLIKTGGFKVGAGEIEACLAGSPGVAEAAVIGLPDPDLGERIVAFVVPRDPASPPAEDALIRRVAAELAPHKRPREVRFLEALPRNAMGKVQKAKLRTP
jgi:malonyl-CoA/methylmalonyl-CoA synthetase